jgi:hypothetical protein
VNPHSEYAGIENPKLMREISKRPVGSWRLVKLEIPDKGKEKKKKG